MTTTAGRGAAVGGAAVDIPVSTKKVVQSLKEVVSNSEEEIYAMLKECNMDPNETAQRLLNQDPFHEVKRKRDKKKETGGIKESTDVRGRPGSGGNYGRGGGRGGGAGRGSSLPRQGSHEYSGGRGRPFGRENGIHPSSRGSSALPGTTSPNPAGQSKAAPSAPISVPAPGASHPAMSQPQAPSSSSGTSPVLANGSAGFVRPAPSPQGAWGSGHATMADILKARAAPPPAFQSPATSLPSQPVLVSAYPLATASAPSSDSSDFYSSTTDPVLHPSLDPRTLGAQAAVKRDLGTVGNQRPIGDRPLSSSAESSSSLPPQPSSNAQAISVLVGEDGGGLDTELDATAERPASPPVSGSPPSNQDLLVEQDALAMEAGNAVGPEGHQHGGRAVLGGTQFSGRSLYGSQQQPVGTQKASSGGGFEWKPKVAPVGSVADGSAQSMSAVDTTRMAQTLQSLSIQDDEPVIIPNHLRVPEADRTQLSFGSFGSDFRTSFGTSFGLEEDDKGPATHVDNLQTEEVPAEQAAPASVAAPVELVQSYGHQQMSTPSENSTSSIEAPSVHSAPAAAPQEQLAKPDPVMQQSAHYPFLGVSNYPGFGLMQQIPGGQYGYEQVDTQPQDIARIPSLMPYSDPIPTTSYYTSSFRPGVDGEGRYPTYATANTSSKYTGNMGIMSGPTLPSSQEGVNPMLASTGPTGAPTSQAANNAQSAQAVPQQALPMHYSAQPPLNHLGFMGYQSMAPYYPYLQSPYHHNYNPSNNAFVQPPTGSSYPPAAASSFPTGAAAAVKYPLPQYKPGSATGSAPHSAGGVSYGGYTTPAGYTGNAVVTTGNGAGYEDVNTSHYKDNTLYIPGQQQGEGSTVWIHTSLPREMGPGGGLQTSSYYNLAGQGQHTGYSHSQQHTHAHPGAGYANMYHPSQSGPAPSHQMLQQPQAMGGVGAGNSQAGAYQQQSQRAQQTWNPSY